MVPRRALTTMKLYGFWRSLASYRVRVALLLKNVAVEEISINLLQGQQHEDVYRAVNPQSVVPALAIDDGPLLVQSLAILEYLDETHPQPPLLPRDRTTRMHPPPRAHPTGRRGLWSHAYATAFPLA